MQCLTLHSPPHFCSTGPDRTGPDRTTTCSLLLLRDHHRRLQMAFWRSFGESFGIARLRYAKFAMLPTAVAAVCANTNHTCPAPICSAREATPRTSTMNNPCHNVPNSGQRLTRTQMLSANALPMASAPAESPASLPMWRTAGAAAEDAQSVGRRSSAPRTVNRL